MWKKGWSWRAGQGRLEREEGLFPTICLLEKKLICGLVIGMRIRVSVVVGQAKSETNRRKQMSTAGIPRSAVRYRPLTESVQEFVVLSPRASRGPSRKPPQRTGSLLPQWIRHRAGHPLVLVGVGMKVPVLQVLVRKAGGAVGHEDGG